MKALVLAAGRGSRLAPLTDEKPKCMVPFLDRPLFEWQLACLRHVGIEEIHVAAGYRADAFQPYGLTVWENPDWAVTNMVASLMSARPVLEQCEDDLLIAYSDIVYEPRLIQALASQAGDLCATIDLGWEDLWRLRMENPYDDAETLQYDSAGRITGIGLKIQDQADVQGQYTGLIKATPDGITSLLAFWDGAGDRPDWALGRDLPNCYMTDFLRGMIEAGHDLHASFVEHGWFEVDTVEDLTCYEDLARAGSFDRFFSDDWMGAA